MEFYFISTKDFPLERFQVRRSDKVRSNIKFQFPRCPRDVLCLPKWMPFLICPSLTPFIQLDYFISPYLQLQTQSEVWTFVRVMFGMVNNRQRIFSFLFQTPLASFVFAPHLIFTKKNESFRDEKLTKHKCAANVYMY